MHRNTVLFHFVFVALCLCIGTIAAPTPGGPIASKAVLAASHKNKHHKHATATTASTSDKDTDETTFQKNYAEPAEESFPANDNTASADTTKLKGLATTAQKLNKTLMDVFTSLGNTKEKA
ncbi:hypothetical protein BDF20DRAFT_894482 [Mycotypha africana]|uniref:uncharacterized protein n=1 Tax=Mycotypha africana TaxID=64632 RepID=UPI00230004B9|nr:uncharacterized protein BDF20DRAFT_894482 [Mycotypha africana]KAI8969323.1 hypothetical protein BDF20DRAFT_894482 [Mycotypha africana]